MKKLAALLCCCILAFILDACGPQLNKEALAPFVGSWDCQDRALEERSTEDALYVGYLSLRVEEDGTFSLYDVEAGNPGMAGKLYPDDGGIIRLDCEADDFDPPYLWYILGITEDGQLKYSFHEEDGTELLHLSYENDRGSVSTLVFERWK